MRKFFLLLLLVVLMAFPTFAQAQGVVKIGELSVQLWPEYDHPDMLVMYSFALTDDTPLPAEVKVRIPANANLNAVAKLEAGQMMNAPYDAPVKDGDWVMITLVISDLSTYRVEYYTPLEKSGATRNFSFIWQSDYAIENLYLQVQQPPTASQITSNPVLASTIPASDGLTYHDLALSGIAAGENFNFELSYEKGNDDLTVSSMPVEVGGATNTGNTSTGGDFSLTDSLPMLLVGLGVVLIVGGVLYFFLAGQNAKSQPKPKRKRHSTASAGANTYCHECGSRARSGDKFCRSCGAKLRI